MIPVSLILLGLSVRHLIGRRRFNRRNAAGRPQFKNYELAVIISFCEHLLNLVASFLIAFGLLAFIF